MKSNTKLVNIIVELGRATTLTMGGSGEYLELGFRPFQLSKNTKQITELGLTSQLTQGSERYGYEYGRPGYPKNGR